MSDLRATKDYIQAMDRLSNINVDAGMLFQLKDSHKADTEYIEIEKKTEGLKNQKERYCYRSREGKTMKKRKKAKKGDEET